MVPPRLLSYLITALAKGRAMLRLTGRAIDRPLRDQGVNFVRGLRAALVLQAIVRPDEAMVANSRGQHTLQKKNSLGPEKTIGATRGI
jgi:hypothetical protein